MITYFNAGGEQTFPVFVWGIARVSVPPQVNVVASAIFLVAIAIALGNVFWQYRAPNEPDKESHERHRDNRPASDAAKERLGLGSAGVLLADAL